MTERILTVHELASEHGVDYQTASGLLRYLREKGIAQEVGARQKAGKGRSAMEYKVPVRVELAFGTATDNAEAA